MGYINFDTEASVLNIGVMKQIACGDMTQYGSDSVTGLIICNMLPTNHDMYKIVAEDRTRRVVVVPAIRIRLSPDKHKP